MNFDQNGDLCGKAQDFWNALHPSPSTFITSPSVFFHLFTILIQWCQVPPELPSAPAPVEAGGPAEEAQRCHMWNSKRWRYMIIYDYIITFDDGLWVWFALVTVFRSFLFPDAARLQQESLLCLTVKLCFLLVRHVIGFHMFPRISYSWWLMVVEDVEASRRIAQFELKPFQLSFDAILVGRTVLL